MNVHIHHKQDYYDDDPLLGGEEAEDAEVLKSLAYAEKKLGKHMGTPKEIKTRRGAPVMYDIEASAQDAADRIGNELNGMLNSEKDAAYMGDCDIQDEHCM